MTTLKQAFSNDSAMVRHLARVVSNYFKTDADFLINQVGGSRQVTKSRDAIVFFLHVYEGLDYQRICEAIAAFHDHSGVGYACRRMISRINLYDDWNDQMTQLKKQIYGR